MVVTDEMIEAAAKAYWLEVYGRHRKSQKWPEDVHGGSEQLFRDGCRAALTAALSALPAGVKVKPLDWQHDGSRSYAYCGVTDTRWTAENQEGRDRAEQTRAARILSALSPAGGRNLGDITDDEREIIDMLRIGATKVVPVEDALSPAGVETETPAPSPVQDYHELLMRLQAVQHGTDRPYAASVCKDAGDAIKALLRTPAPSTHLEGVYIIPRELTDEEWSEVKYNVDRKADPDIPLWRIQEAVKYANHIAGHRGRKMIETPSPQPNVAPEAAARWQSLLKSFKERAR